MKIRHCLYIGIKLIGLYFGVLGVTILSMTVISFVIQVILPIFQRNGFLNLYEGQAIGLISLLQPIAYLVCAFVLTRKTDWCLDLIDGESLSS